MSKIPKGIPQPNGDVLLPRPTVDYIVAAVGEAAQAFADSDGLLATEHTCMPDGVEVTGERFVEIENSEVIEKMNKVGSLLSTDESEDPSEE
ncbi:hypothetical protein [Caenimonas soli]|uniref:hypothetical protein n=1 Tax=Caenimonas soli TaxID=2735555 RepID=UPI001557797E|nr:hypothetical protein [Caenimonas soli]NPC54645.1 hypothetical protein [Caenimonas soli]